MRRKIPVIFKLIILNFSVICAGGLLALFLSSLSKARAASSVSISDTRILDDIYSERWRIFADMQKERGDPGVVAYNKKIYVMGGYFPSSYGYNQTQEVYDPQTNTWQYLANLPIGESDMMVATYSNTIYAIGGWNLDLGGPMSYTHAYNPLANKWITKNSMITPVSGAGVVVMTNTIYVLGGYGHLNSIAGAVQKYNPISDTWSLGTPMSVPRSELGAVILNGKIYAIGGVTDNGVTTNTVEIYDPITDQWTDGPPLPEGRASMAVGVRLGKIYVVGGTNDWSAGTPTNTVFVFDPGTNEWSTIRPLPTSRTACRGAVVNDIIYVIGGKGDPGAGSANEGFGFPPISSTVTISSDSPNPSQVNQPFTITYDVTATGVMPTGVVSMTVESRTETCYGTLTNGLGSCRLALDTPGSYSLTATYSGNYILLSSSITKTHTVVKANTNTAITAVNPNPSVIGRPITVTYAVTSPFGQPTGSVSVTASGSTESCLGGLINGVGSCFLTLNAAGPYTLTARYNGDSNFNPSFSSRSHTVSKFDTTTTILSDRPDPSLLNEPINVTFMVTSPDGIPTGPVKVTVNNSPITCSSMLINGMGNCSISIQSIGTYSLNAVYKGDAIFNSSSDTETHIVAPYTLFLPLTR
jgi:N-acetylneuraminic acid mutarotase